MHSQICMSFATTLSFLEMSSELFGQTIASTLSAGIRALGSDIVGMVEAVTQRFNDVQICIKLVVCKLAGTYVNFFFFLFVL